MKTSTVQDALIARLSCRDIKAFGENLQCMLSGCCREVAFRTSNVVARVTYMSTLGMHALISGRLKQSFQTLSMLHRFAGGKMSWRDFVFASDKIGESMRIPKELSEESRNYLRQNAYVLMTFVYMVPGDLGIGIVQDSLETTTQSYDCVSR